MANKLNQLLFQSVDNSPLIFFRIVVGLLMAAEGFGAIATGWVTEAFVDTKFNFTIIGFEWLQPLPSPWMYICYIILGISGLMVMLGWRYRLGAIVYAVLWTLVYMMQKSHYNNHYYLMVLVAWAMVFLPANGYASFDAKRNPAIKRLTCPRWCHLFFIVQLFIVYTYASIAKLYPDWLELKPITQWMAKYTDLPVIGGFFSSKWGLSIIAYGGIIFDGLIVPALLWKRTRTAAFIISFVFHLGNSALFGIGIFPYFMLGACAFFFPAERVRQVFFKKKPPLTESTELVYPKVKQQLVMGVLAIYFSIQIWLPLRHLYYPGIVHWTEEGHRLAWQMMLRSKGGYVYFTVKTDSITEYVKMDEHLTTNQIRSVATHPDMAWQFAQYLKKHYTKLGHTNIQVYARGAVSLNGRDAQPLYNPEVDLANVKWTRFKSAPWLMPFEY